MWKWVIFHQAALSDGGMSQGFITFTIKTNKNPASAQRIDLITRFQPFQAVQFAALAIGFSPSRTDQISFNLIFINLSCIYFSICCIYSISPKLNQPAFLFHPWLVPNFRTPFFSRKTYGQNVRKIISSPVKSYEFTRNRQQISPWVQWGHNATPWVNLVTQKETFKLLSTSLIF